MSAPRKPRGKLAPLAPYLGDWEAVGDSPMGRYRVARSMAPFGAGWVEARVRWEIGDREPYQEIALYGPAPDGRLRFFSYTSDGKPSHGVQADAPDVHAAALAFEARMPAGTARMVFWPDETEGFHWAVESKNRKGWNRFTEHHYRATEAR